MRKAKICLLGAFATGKTSLTRRVVEGLFSERYLATVGVKIDHHDVDVDSVPLRLVLWDINGEDEFIRVHESYLRGAAACVLVVDGTRAWTLATALDLRQRALTALGPVPMMLLLNKADLRSEWELQPQAISDLGAECPILQTSAKSSEGVDAAFLALARRLIASGGGKA